MFLMQRKPNLEVVSFLIGFTEGFPAQAGSLSAFSPFPAPPLLVFFTNKPNHTKSTNSLPVEKHVTIHHAISVHVGEEHQHGLELP
jgi:hypothetical protein